MFPMDTQIYPLLDKDTDESYPKNRYHQYIKLLTHAYSFGRIDLYFLIFEWLAYLAYTILSVLKLSGSIKWDWGYTSFPLYIGLGTGVLRSFLCGKMSKCSVSARVFFSGLGLLDYIFIILKAGDYVDWSWNVVFIPIYGSFGLVGLMLIPFTIWTFCTTKTDYVLKMVLCCFSALLTALITFSVLLSKKLDGDTAWSWFQVVSPLWIANALFLACGIVFILIFPDNDFISDSIVSSGSRVLPSIKPRYRSIFFFIACTLANIPITIFTVLIAFRLEFQSVSVSVVFVPLLLGEVILLGFIVCLIHARRQKGTYCIKINKGTSTPSEIW